MYLEDGREIYESDKYPGCYINADTGDFCDENGNYMGGNQDNGDEPGGGSFFDSERVWITKSGKLYYPQKTKSATISILLYKAKRNGYRPSAGYKAYKAKENKKKYKELIKEIRK